VYLVLLTLYIVVLVAALKASLKQPNLMFPSAPGLHVLFAVFPPTVIPEALVLLVEFYGAPYYGPTVTHTQ